MEMVPVLVSTGFGVRNNQAGLSLTSLGLVFVISNINGVLDGDQWKPEELSEGWHNTPRLAIK